MCGWNETVTKQTVLCPSYKGQQHPNSVQKGQRGGSQYLKTLKHLHTVYTNKSAWKTEGLAQSVLNMVVTTSMDRDASLDSILVYVQIQIKVEEDEFSLLTAFLCLTKTNLIWRRWWCYRQEKASLSANAPACVAVWGWEELAGCVRWRAPPLASGIAPDPDDWKGKRMGGSSVYQMFWGKKDLSYEKAGTAQVSCRFMYMDTYSRRCTILHVWEVTDWHRIMSKRITEKCALSVHVEEYNMKKQEARMCVADRRKFRQWFGQIMTTML